MIRQMKKFLLSVISKLPFVNTEKGTKCLDRRSALLFGCKVNNYGNNNHVLVRKDCILKDTMIEIHGSNNYIEIGDCTKANHMHIFIEDNNNKVVIGRNNTFAGSIHLACTEGVEIEIGNDCLFSSEIVIRTGDSHSIVDLNGKRINYAQNVIIGNHVWCGFRTMITKGVKLPSNCVVGTGALVTKEFTDEHIVIAGVPAKIVRNNVDWLSKRI